METNTTVGAGSEGDKTKCGRCWVPTLVRWLMGLAFLVFGLNGFLNFIPQPKTPMPAAAMDFAGALMKTGYMMPLVAGTQVLVGALLLTNLFVPLALALIAPIIVGIMTFHIFLAPSTIGPGVAVLVMELFLAWTYRDAFRPMLAMRARSCGK